MSGGQSVGCPVQTMIVIVVAQAELAMFAIYKENSILYLWEERDHRFLRQSQHGSQPEVGRSDGGATRMEQPSASNPESPTSGEEVTHGAILDGEDTWVQRAAPFACHGVE